MWKEYKDKLDNEEDYSEEYSEFIKKFENKKTTDDCYTPDAVYEVVEMWVCEKYGKNKENFVRPFYPGGDYQTYEYKPTDIVVDNPPFSIMAEILRFYNEHNIKFFMFAPSLTLFGKAAEECCACICVDEQIVYENGAVVNTSFYTNLEENIRFKSEPELERRLAEANKKNNKNTLPKYEYPPEVVTACTVKQLSRYGIEFSVSTDESERITTLDSQRETGAAIFGGGYLISEQKTEELIEAQSIIEERKIEKQKAKLKSLKIGEVSEDGKIQWKLSEREKEIVKSLSEK